MIKAFVFDIDNTLYSYDTAHKTAFQAVTDYVCPAFGLAPDEFAALHRQGDRLLRQRVGSVTAAIHNRLIRYQIILEELGQPIRHAPAMAGAGPAQRPGQLRAVRLPHPGREPQVLPLQLLAVAPDLQRLLRAVEDRPDINLRRVLSALTMLQLRGQVEEKSGKRFYAAVVLRP